MKRGQGTGKEREPQGKGRDREKTQIKRRAAGGAGSAKGVLGFHHEGPKQQWLGPLYRKTVGQG